jgi:hypothetical protein
LGYVSITRGFPVGAGNDEGKSELAMTESNRAGYDDDVVVFYS